MSDLISTEEAVAKIVDTAMRNILSGEQKLTKEYEQSVKEAVNVVLNTTRRTAQPEIVRCKECIMHDVCRFEQGLGVDGYCSQAERRTDETN